MRLHFNLRGLTVHSLVWLALSTPALFSCQSTPARQSAAKPAQSQKVTPTQKQIAAQATAAAPQQAKPTEQELQKPDPEEPPPPAEPVLSAADKARLAMEQKFLEEAGTAFRAGRLTEPPHDNAYDRFQSVLMLNPDNNVARAGVQAILLNYTDRIRNAISEGHGGFAASLLRKAELYYPANPLLMDLKKEVARLNAREEEMLLSSENISDDARMEFPLPPGALSRKSSTVSDYLTRIALRVKETDESIMIYARSDAEGRWIYSQLKDAVPGYRVRGDIRISQSPKISILPPLQ